MPQVLQLKAVDMYNTYHAYGLNSTVLLDVPVGRPKIDVTIFVLACDCMS